MMNTLNKTVAEVAPRQANYLKYRLPDGLDGLAHAPLYQVVAVWGWRLGRPFCRPEVAEAFGISLCRAGDVMSYIRRARPDLIKSRQYHERLPHGVRQRFLQILADPRVTGRPAMMQKVQEVQETPPTGAAKTEVDLQALRGWFLRRPNQD